MHAINGIRSISAGRFEMKGFWLFLLLVLSFSADMYAKGEEDDAEPHRIAIGAALTSPDTYVIECSYHYMLKDWLGVGGALGRWKALYSGGYPSGKGWYIEDDDERPNNLFLRPSLVLKSPSLHFLGASFSLMAEPGIMFNIPYLSVLIKDYNGGEEKYNSVSTTRGRWIAPELKIGLGVDIGPIGIWCGYLISDLDIFSAYRHLSYNGISFKQFYPRKELMQGAFISLFCTVPWTRDIR